MTFFLYYNKSKYEKVPSVYAKHRILFNSKTIKYFIIIFLFIYASFLVVLVVHFDEWQRFLNLVQNDRQLFSNEIHPITKKYVYLNKRPHDTHSLYKNCHLMSDECFDFYNCVLNRMKRSQSIDTDSSLLRVFIYNLSNVEFVDDVRLPLSTVDASRRINLKDSFSKEFIELIETIKASKYYEPNPAYACIYVPQIDMLNENNFDSSKIEKILFRLKYWKNGMNHLLFNMLPKHTNGNKVLNMEYGKALIASSGFDNFNHRNTFDISMPLFNPMSAHMSHMVIDKAKRKWTLIMTETSLDDGKMSMFKKLEHKQYRGRFRIFGMCTPNNNYYERCVQNEIYSYPSILGDSVFCVITETNNHAYLLSLFDALKFNCIPVIVFDELILPFDEKIDWKSAVIRVRESHIMSLIDIIDNVNADVVDMMLNYIQIVYTQYYSSIQNITLTTLDILDSRIYKKNSRV